MMIGNVSHYYNFYIMVIEDLEKASCDVSTLQNFLSDNFIKVYDFFRNQKHSDLVTIRDKLNRYILLNRNVILKLDINENSNFAFISLLLDISEELGFISSFGFLFDFLKTKNYNIGERLKAASLYLVDIKTADDYLNRYEHIFNHLQISSKTEEDNTDRVLMTMVNYYAKVVYDFGEFNLKKVLELKTKLQKSFSDSEYSFIHNNIIEKVLEVDVSKFRAAYLIIHELLDSFLGRDIIKPYYRQDFLTELGTEYCDSLARVPNKFKDIRELSVKKAKFINTDTIFTTLGRGVAILTEEDQLYTYMYSYGKMHYEKLINAFVELPKNILNKKTEIIDWGCGQAIASMVYLEYLNEIGAEITPNNIILIEPSEIALRRASLHISNIYSTIHIKTINKDIDALRDEDFLKNINNRRIHLFSNILDIDNFSLTALTKLIEINLKGDNYFICLSPYINDIRTSRIDAFVKYFSTKNNFELIYAVDNKAGEWKGKWTRVIRIFKVKL